jgi:hypothetical protein
LNSACPEDALCVIDVNFTTGIETGWSFMTLGHWKSMEGTHAELSNSTGVESPVGASLHMRIRKGSRVVAALAPSVRHS